MIYKENNCIKACNREIVEVLKKATADVSLLKQNRTTLKKSAREVSIERENDKFGSETRISPQRVS